MDTNPSCGDCRKLGKGEECVGCRYKRLLAETGVMIENVDRKRAERENLMRGGNGNIFETTPCEKAFADIREGVYRRRLERQKRKEGLGGSGGQEKTGEV